MLHKLRQTFKILEGSHFFMGLSMLIMNIASRYVILDLPYDLEDYLLNPTVRASLAFCMVFVATKDVATSIFFALLVALFIKTRVKNKVINKK